VVTADSARDARMEGLTLVGQLVGLDEAYSFTGRDGTEVSMKPAIKVLVNEHIEKVPYDPVRVDVGMLIGNAVKGDLIAIPVRASGPYDNETGRSAPVRFRVWTPQGPAPVDVG